MTFEQTLILEFVSIIKWVLIIGSFFLGTFLVGRNLIDYILGEVEEPKK